jgi:hypothetical protein
MQVNMQFHRRKYGCRVYVAHVVEPFMPPMTSVLTMCSTQGDGGHCQKIADNTASMKRTGADIESVLLSGNPSAEIVSLQRRDD